MATKKREFSPAELSLMRERYRYYHTSAEIARELGTNKTRVLHELKNMGVRRKSPGEYRRGFVWTPEMVADVIRKYQRYQPISAIGYDYGVSGNCISMLLDRHGVRRHTQGDTRRGWEWTPAMERDIVSRYQAGEGIWGISQDYRVSVKALYRVLRRHGVPIRRHGGRIRTADIPQDVIDSIVADYQAGYGGTTVACRLGVTVSMVYRSLRRAGVPTRKSNDPLYRGKRKRSL